MRSAEPETSPGCLGKTASKTFCTATRVAIDSPSAKFGNASCQSLRPPFHAAVHSCFSGLASRRPSQAKRCCAPRTFADSRQAATTSKGAQKGSSGIFIACFVRVTCSALKGLPCASCFPVQSGEGKPTWVRRINNFGRSSFESRAAVRADSRASKSSPIAPRLLTDQP